MAGLILEAFQSEDGPRWRVKGLNGEVLATSEAYSDEQARDKTLLLVSAHMLGTEVKRA